MCVGLFRLLNIFPRAHQSFQTIRLNLLLCFCLHCKHPHRSLSLNLNACSWGCECCCRYSLRPSSAHYGCQCAGQGQETLRHANAGAFSRTRHRRVHCKFLDDLQSFVLTSTNEVSKGKQLLSMLTLELSQNITPTTLENMCSCNTREHAHATTTIENMCTQQYYMPACVSAANQWMPGVLEMSLAFLVLLTQL